MTSKFMRVPNKFYTFIKESATRNNRNMTQETSLLLDKYLESENTLKKLEGKKVLVIGR